MNGGCKNPLYKEQMARTELGGDQVIDGSIKAIDIDLVDLVSSLSPNKVVSTTSSTYNVLSDDVIIMLDASSNNITVNMPLAADITGRTISLMRVDDDSLTTNTITIQAAGSDTIIGETSKTIAYQNTLIVLIAGQGNRWI